ncbi:lmo0937 family membrane protein [Flavobacterium alkalisoli]|uniref:Lmo0937 family membrane protein n=1 Tax=Flavobacterium alkalisoli TaxID=2602769 RepID=A0A5B9FVA7_9FLAO|nr:lmo0937 family membrane protein [Flavobacterium alkalisoli]QEE49996.1 lmo0937 family membrane protein [Flavobacterium alkalisoli]
MKNLLFIIAFVLVILWALGSFVVHVGGALIHLLLLVALIAILVNVLKGNKPLN